MCSLRIVQPPPPPQLNGTSEAEAEQCADAMGLRWYAAVVAAQVAEMHRELPAAKRRRAAERRKLTDAEGKIARLRQRHGRVKPVECVQTGDVWPSAVACAKAIGMRPGTLIERLRHLPVVAFGGRGYRRAPERTQEVVEAMIAALS